MRVARARDRGHSPGFVAARAAAAVILFAVGACGGGDGITVSNNVASIRFVTQPGTIAINTPFTVEVELLNSNGARITSATNVVTLSATGATLNGATSVAAVAGVATFAGLSFTTAGASVQLQAAAGGRSVTSSAFAATDPCEPVALGVPGSANGSVSSSSCLLGGVRAAVFRFTAPAGGASAFSTTAAFPARVEVTTEPAGSNVSVTNSQSSTVTGEWLLPAGTYRFNVGAQSGTGTFSVTATNPAGNQGCAARIFVVGGVFSQTLGAGDCLYENVADWFFDAFVIFANQPCTITMRSSAFDAYLELWDASSGSVLAEDDDSGGGTDAQLVRNQCTAGGNPVVIVTNSLLPGGAGAYTVTVQLGTAAADVALDAPTVSPITDVSALTSFVRPPPRGVRTKR